MYFKRPEHLRQYDSVYLGARNDWVKVEYHEEVEYLEPLNKPRFNWSKPRQFPEDLAEALVLAGDIQDQDSTVPHLIHQPPCNPPSSMLATSDFVFSSSQEFSEHHGVPVQEGITQGTVENFIVMGVVVGKYTATFCNLRRIVNVIVGNVEEDTVQEGRKKGSA
ncbi:hypothetical protein M427DRAFT_46509 [Gonapodya prolifera JEL478]|uniref:Uncharacterized protein n=1 Tax=Gonapodya prolifera (strain JEL478) TaxID=1344416 RepID=A0A139A670_GONPJ|nr:hypothetical protein M427DRAFT_46509 [Gonapodya prolifera JEL478]|eukprot:KXS12251.1 hypothetical protein M427DRAFT_46509 [Gonapodya prolifera JEL478]